MRGVLFSCIIQFWLCLMVWVGLQSHHVHAYGNFSSEDPILNSLKLDKSTISVVLGFDRYVDATTLNISKVHFQGVQNVASIPSGASASNYVISFNSFQPTLTQLQSQGNRTMTVTVYFTLDQYSQMVMMTNTFTSSSTVYVALDRGAVLSTPYVGNFPSRPVATSAAFKVTTYTEDSLNPYLISFGANMNQATVTLLFSEPILLSSISTLGLAAQIQSNSIGGTGAYAQFVANKNPVVSALNYQRNITLSLGTTNVDLITSNLNLWSSLLTCYLSAWQSFATDLVGNPVTTREIDIVQALAASYYITDVTPPTLLNWDMDFNGKCSRSLQNGAFANCRVVQLV
jgi:hypothetical protein